MMIKFVVVAPYRAANSAVINNNMGTMQQSPRTVSPSPNITELTEIVSGEQAVYQEIISQSQCCGWKYSTVNRKKFVWEDNFLSNCNVIRQEFKWVDPLIELVKNNKLSRAKFMREISQLKMEISCDSFSEREQLLSSAEVEEFKINLKKSVLISFGRANKLTPDRNERITTTMNPRLTRMSIDHYQNFRNSHLKGDNKSMSNLSRNSTSKSILRKSIMSFVDDTLSSVFGCEKEISRENAKDLEHFLKFTMILERHLNDPLSILCQMRRVFASYLEKHYSDPVQTSLRMADLTDSVRQFLVLFRQTIVDYYRLVTFSGEGNHLNNLIANDENILSVATAILFKDGSIHNIVFNAGVCLNRSREEEFAKILESLQQASPESFSVKKEYCLNNETLKAHMASSSPCSSMNNKLENLSISELSDTTPQPYKDCMLVLNQLAKSRTPIAKMKAIMSCSQRITKEISRFYAYNNLQMKQWVLDADQILSIFCFIIVGARVPNLHSHLYMLENFATEHQLISVTGYYYSVLTCALEQIETEFSKKY